jgi:hypothetical protein
MGLPGRCAAAPAGGGRAWSARRWRAAGVSSAGSVPASDLARTRATLVSTGATRSPRAKQATARAVYGPTPGRSASSSTVPGQPPRSATAWAVARRARARRL